MNFPAPPEEDSPDLTDEDVVQAVPTEGAEDLARKLAEAIQSNPGMVLELHELRKRKPHLYWRARFTSGSTLVFLADWLQKSC